MTDWSDRDIVSSEKKLFCDFPEGDEPFFIKRVLSDTHLKKKSKNQFVKKFLKFYNLDINFRKEVVEKYLFWFNGEYIGVKEKLTDVLEYGTYKNDRYFIQITNHCDTQYLTFSSQN